MTSKTIAVILASIIVLGIAGGYVMLSQNGNDDNGGSDDNGGGDEPIVRDSINIVTLGASNTNGYGMRGYVSESEIEQVLNDKSAKDELNVYGYQRLPEGAYPDLLRDHYVGVYGEDKVTIDQLAISSMRVEELRILLDDTYDGDDYSEWRFTGNNGWFLAAEEGGLNALRQTYAQKVTDADLITVDIGWNNFGVYVCNQLMEYLSNGQYLWTADISEIFDTDSEIAAGLEAKELIRGYITGFVGDNELSDALADVFAYSILGYMHNFDIVMDRIYELNPDADVVVIGIQNLLYGIKVELGDQTIPLGDIFGNFVDMANYYASSCSPHHEDYLYVKVGVDEHASIFLDYMKDYDGDVANLDQNVKDCFDYYDDNLFIQSTIDDAMAGLLEDTLGSAITLFGFDNAKDFVSAGKKGELRPNFQSIFNGMYWPALNAAYDTLATLVMHVANMPTLNADALVGGSLNIGDMESMLEGMLMAEIEENVMSAAMGGEYTVDAESIFSDDASTIVASMYVRFYMGNAFFIHPDAKGHLEVKNAVIAVLENPDSEKDQTLEDYLIDSVNEIHQLLCGGAGHDMVDGTCTICGKASP